MLVQIMFFKLLLLVFVTMTTVTASVWLSMKSDHHPGCALVGHVFKTLPLFIADCLKVCHETMLCFSINVYKDKQGGDVCELNQMNKKQSPESFVHKAGYIYAEPTDICATPRCMNGGTCEDLLNDFRCHCPKGFTGKRCETNGHYWQWLKINTSPVCFGALDSSYGRFYVKVNGTALTVKLVHLSGFVSCNKAEISMRSNWGCKEANLLAIVTDSTNTRILPQDEFINSFHYLDYSIPGVTATSKELVFKKFTVPRNVFAGQEYRIWYGEDLKDATDENNEGTSCVDVFMYGLFS